MKKNKMLRLASVLMVCVLLTISVISGAYAKYTTKVQLTDTARVAKWGVTFETTSDLFAEAYKDTAVTDNTATVKVSAAGTNLVAPGTEGTGFGVKTTDSSKPEVSYNMTIQLDADNSKMPTLKYTPAGEGASATTYEPVMFSVYNGDTQLGTDMTFSELKTLLGTEKTIYKYDVAAGKYTVDTDLDGDLTDTTATPVGAVTTETKPDIKIKWKWAIDTGADDEKALNTKLDTILGDIAAELDVTDSTAYKLPAEIASVDKNNSNIDVNFVCTMTATQID